MPTPTVALSQLSPSFGFRPDASRNVSAAPLDDSLVLYDDRTQEGFVLNPTAAWIWERCDGSRPLGTLADEFSRSFGIPAPQALRDVNELVSDLRTAKLVEYLD